MDPAIDRWEELFFDFLLPDDVRLVVLVKPRVEGNDEGLEASVGEVIRSSVRVGARSCTSEHSR